MHIDAHQHFWRYDRGEYGWIDDSMAVLRRDFLPADLKPELDRSGFQGCVAVQARQTLEETRWLLELAERAPFLRGVVGWVDLRSPRLRFELKSFAGNSKLVGVRHVVQSEPDERFLLQPDFLRGIAMLEEFDLAYDILIYPRHLPVAFECFGPSRLMIGSDWPVCTVAAPYSRVMEVVKNYISKYAAEERNAVLGGNAAKFWRLKPLENQARD